MKLEFTARQGDVSVFRILDDDAPEGATPLRREKGRVVLAHGEVTGHAHVIEHPGATLHSLPPAVRVALAKPETRDLAERDEAVLRYLTIVGRDAAALVHEEHGRVVLPPGRYLVARQYEYEPAALRTVQD